MDVALDLGLPPVLHERKPGAREVSRRELVSADELTQEELLGGAMWVIGTYEYTVHVRFLGEKDGRGRLDGDWLILKLFVLALLDIMHDFRGLWGCKTYTGSKMAWQFRKRASFVVIPQD